MGRVQSEFSCAGACWRMEIAVFRLPARACCRLAITVGIDKCCDWLQLPHAKIILFRFRHGSMLKYYYFRTVDRRRRLGLNFLK